MQMKSEGAAYPRLRGAVRPHSKGSDPHLTPACPPASPKQVGHLSGQAEATFSPSFLSFGGVPFSQRLLLRALAPQVNQLRVRPHFWLAEEQDQGVTHLIRRAVPVAFGALLAACGGAGTTTATLPGAGTTTATLPGVITGVASPCVGYAATASQMAMLPVRVTLTEGSRSVTSVIVRGSHTYRFAEPPGRYVVLSDQAGVTPAIVNLRSGQVAHIDLISPCM